MRLSDILKKKEGVVKPSKPPISEPAAETPKGPPKEPEITKPPQVDKVSLPSAEKVYGEAILKIREIFQSITKKKIQFNTIYDIVSQIDSLINANNEDLLLFIERATPDLYLYAHSVNVGILSSLIGSSREMSGEDQSKLTFSALLHDLGMTKTTDLSLKTRKLTSQEFTEIKRHSEYTVSLLDNIENITEEWKSLVKKIVLQIHERKSGSGYPSGLKEEDIHEFARIIGIADTYEALTHPRSWRDRYLPHEALKMLIELSETDFDLKLVKLFLGRISLYPPGSFVRLNTEEIARVSGVNQNLPTRPKVKVIIDDESKRVKEQKIIDLAESTMISITEPIDETKLKSIDKKLALELKAHRWWIKGL